jgi:hypothetical protein
MLSFQLNSKHTHLLKELQSNFSLQYAAIKTLNPEELDFIHRYARISMIGASTRIENAILTDSEISWIDTVLTNDGKTTAFQKHKQENRSKTFDRSRTKH